MKRIDCSGRRKEGRLVRAAAMLAIAAASCQTILSSNEREKQFEDLFPIEMNSQLTLSQEEQFGEARIGWSFSLLLQNHTHRPIWIGWDQNPRVCRYAGDAEGWVEIPDRGVRMHEGETLAPIGEGLFATVLGVAADLEPNEAPVDVRVVVVGRIVSGGMPTGQEVGAFIDINIQP